MQVESPILKIRNLTKQYGNGCPNCLQENANLEKNFCPICKTVFACKDVSIDLYRGEILGIVGESGSGKSTLMKSLYFDEEVTSGAGYLEDFHNGSLNIFTQSEQQKRYIRNTLLGMVYQNPMLGLKMSFLLLVILQKSKLPRVTDM